MKGVIVCAVLIFVAMALIKDGRVLRTVGLTGGCSAVAAPSGQTGSWERCVPGKLQGAPDLSRQGCISAGIYNKAELWRCPADIQAGPTT
jgi:hypothetical protein